MPYLDDPRFEIIPAQDIVTEAVAPQINIYWNPETNKGSVAFWVEHQEFRNGVFTRRYADNRAMMRPLATSLDDVIYREHTIEFPDGSTLTCPPGTLGLLVRKLFPVHYAEQLERMTQEFVPVQYEPQYDENGVLIPPPTPETPALGSI